MGELKRPDIILELNGSPIIKYTVVVFVWESTFDDPLFTQEFDNSADALQAMLDANQAGNKSTCKVLNAAGATGLYKIGFIEVTPSKPKRKCRFWGRK